MKQTVSEVRTTRQCAHPYFGFVCVPNSSVDYADTIAAPLGRQAIGRIDAFGFRNIDLPPSKPEDETWIGLFGGSVAFSVASSDNGTTIAGFLERALNARAENADVRRRRIRVLNFALPAGQQPQQLIIFMSKSRLLDGAITLDGVNEVVIPAYYNRDVIPGDFPYLPFYQALFARDVSDEQIALSWLVREEEQAAAVCGDHWLGRIRSARHHKRAAALRARLESTATSSHLLQTVFPMADAGVDGRIEAGAENWRRCTRLMARVASAEGIDFLPIVQPVPEQGKTLALEERAFVDAHPDVVSIRGHGLGLLRRHAAALRDDGVPVEDFVNVFSGHEKQVYVDLGHFNDLGCQVVADAMADFVGKRWTCLQRPT